MMEESMVQREVGKSISFSTVVWIVPWCPMDRSSDRRRCRQGSVDGSAMKNGRKRLWCNIHTSHPGYSGFQEPRGVD